MMAPLPLCLDEERGRQRVWDEPYLDVRWVSNYCSL